MPAREYCQPIIANSPRQEGVLDKLGRFCLHGVPSKFKEMRLSLTCDFSSELGLG